LLDCVDQSKKILVPVQSDLLGLARPPVSQFQDSPVQHELQRGYSNLIV
jgi:hypothetical protein